MNEAQIQTEAAASLSWLQRHERIVLVVLVLSAMLWAGQKYLNVKAAHDAAAANVAIRQLDDQKATNAQVALQIQQQATQYQALVTELAQENATLASAMSHRTVVLNQQQTADKTLPLPDLGNRWAGLAGVKPADISANPAGITVSDTGARQTVATLEQVPVLTADLKDETTVAANREAELNQANDLVTGLTTQVSGLNVTVAEEEKTCKVEIQAEKSAANKSKSKWFRVGFVSGNITGFVAGLFIGRHV